MANIPAAKLDDLMHMRNLLRQCRSMQQALSSVADQAAKEGDPPPGIMLTIQSQSCEITPSSIEALRQILDREVAELTQRLTAAGVDPD